MIFVKERKLKLNKDCVDAQFCPGYCVHFHFGPWAHLWRVLNLGLEPCLFYLFTLVACPSSGQPRLVTPDSPPDYCPRPLLIAPHLHTQLKHSSAPPGYHEPAHLRAWHLPRQHSSSALSPSTCPLWSAWPLQVASLAAATGGLCNAQLLISHAVSSSGASTPTST